MIPRAGSRVPGLTLVGPARPSTSPGTGGNLIGWSGRNGDRLFVAKMVSLYGYFFGDRVYDFQIELILINSTSK